MSVDYFVKTSRFEGPLDLLLHLIRVHEIDIFDIDVFLLTQEYVNYLRLMAFNDLQQAGEFLEMAATLIEIKSRQLLPYPFAEKKAGEEDLEEDDSIKTLQERLQLHETFRNVADHFNQMPQMGVEIQTNNEWNRLMPVYEHVEAPLTGEPATLVVLYEQLLKGLSERRKSKVIAKKHRITVDETIERLGAEIDTSRFALFQGLFNRLESRDELVVHILAMLELVKIKRIKLYQQDMFGPIWMYRMDCEEIDLPIRAIATPEFGDVNPDLVVETEHVAESQEW